MMFGVVNDSCEAIIKIAVGRIGSPKITVDAVIDTEFTSFLSFAKSSVAEQLNRHASPCYPLNGMIAL